MSDLRVGGSARQEFEVDRFIIKISIKANGRSSGEAIETGRKRTEQFLLLMKEKVGFDPSDFILGDHSVIRSYGENSPYWFNKKISVMVVADLVLVEKLSMILETMSDIEYSIDFEMSNESEKEKIVLQNAIEDSRRKAEIIASSLGQKIVGAGDVDYDQSPNEISHMRERGIAANVLADPIDDLSSKLKKPIKTISKTINIVWITE